MKSKEARPRHAAATGVMLAAVLSAAPGATAAAQDTEEQARVRNAAAVLRAVTDDEGLTMPDRLLERAKGIAVIPHVVRGAFLVGGRWGKGVVAARDADGAWGPASFVDLGGASLGFQIGGDASDLIMVFVDDDGLETLLEDRVQLGGNVSVSAGPVGGSAEAGTNVTLDSAIYTYSRSKGLFAGAALDGTVLTIDDSANQTVFGREIDGDVVMSGSIERPAIFDPFVEALEEVTTPMAE